jgi:hypothetical protein
MATAIIKKDTESSSTVAYKQNGDGSQRFSFLEAGTINSEFSLTNLEQRNSLIENFELGLSLKKTANFSLTGDYENELNALRLGNRKKLLEKEYIQSRISLQNEERKFVDQTNQSRMRYTARQVQKFVPADVNNFFAVKRVLKPDFLPIGQEQQHEALHRRLQTIQRYTSEMYDIIKEEKTLEQHLKSIQSSILDDIVS